MLNTPTAMRVLHVHYIDRNRGTTGGGGAILMNRLHQGLRKQEIDSRILCLLPTQNSDESTSIPRFSFPRLEAGLQKLTQTVGLNDVHRLGTFKIKETDAYTNADVMHLHCTHGGFFNYLALPSLTNSKPTVFTLHDMWPFTGHCANSFGCSRWMSGCGRCPYLHVYPQVSRDATAWEWKLKKWVYSRSKFTVVAPSKWMYEQAKESMLNHLPIRLIPNSVDTKTFQPLEPEQCRSMLGIPADKWVLMFSTPNLRNPGKGADLLVVALQCLPESTKNRIVLLLVGVGGDEIVKTTSIPAVTLGYVSHEPIAAMAYSAADLFVFPTRADNCPLVVLESMACGTPVVSFRVGGVPDLVRPGVTGYLAEPGNPRDLTNGILQLLADETLRRRMSQQCRSIAVQEYSVELMVDRYIELYKELLYSSRESPEDDEYPISSSSRMVGSR